MKYNGKRVEATPLSLPPLDLHRTSDDDFMSDLVKGANELRQTTKIVAHLMPQMELRPINFAVLMGLMVRLHKLYDSFVWTVCDHRLEIALLLGRSACDTAIDISYLCKNMYDAEFDKFVKSSLGTSKKIYDEVEKDRSSGTGNPAIQDRIQASVREDFAISGFSLGEVKPSDTWGFGSTYDRANACGMGREYTFIYKNLSRITHGAWSELLSYHLLRSDDTWYPNVKYSVPKASALDGTSVLIADATAVYAKAIDPNSEAAGRIRDIRAWFVAMAHKHEDFLSKSGKES